MQEGLELHVRPTWALILVPWATSFMGICECTCADTWACVLLSPTLVTLLHRSWEYVCMCMLEYVHACICLHLLYSHEPRHSWYLAQVASWFQACASRQRNMVGVLILVIFYLNNILLPKAAEICEITASFCSKFCWSYACFIHISYSLWLTAWEDKGWWRKSSCNGGCCCYNQRWGKESPKEGEAGQDGADQSKPGPFRFTEDPDGNFLKSGLFILICILLLNINSHFITYLD